MTITDALLHPDHTMVRWREPFYGVTRDGKKWTCSEYHSMTVNDALRRQWREFPASRAETYAAALGVFLARRDGELVPAPDYARPDTGPAQRDEDVGLPVRGMTLRQWYAGQALAGCLSQPGGDEVELDYDDNDIERAFCKHRANLAKACFDYADAMIAHEAKERPDDNREERTHHAQVTRTA